jgi:hypothetical protein
MLLHSSVSVQIEQKHFTMDLCLCGVILNLKAFCFGAIPDIMIKVDSLLECTTKQAVMTVAQWHRNQIIRGLWLLAKQMFKWDDVKIEDQLLLLPELGIMQFAIDAMKL